ncbi:MAG TPA: hypothetical protein VNK45_01650 [Candidatus Acidoferrales bacterium]|nr:hypothetical protein [Candidatus Acidoferrales bacterium]
MAGKPRRIPATLCIFLLYMDGLHAEIYRCEQAGRTVLTDQPCAGGRIEHVAPHPAGALDPAGRQAQAERIRQYERESAAATAALRKADREWLADHAREQVIEQAYQRREIVAGMSRDQVRQLLGAPIRIGRWVDADGPGERWHYPDRGEGPSFVLFQDGRVTAYGNSGRPYR